MNKNIDIGLIKNFSKGSITSHSRGHETYYDGSVWRFMDNDMVVDDKRPCKRCGRLPTPEGYDACMGHVEGAVSVCCGHGVEGDEIMMMEVDLVEATINKLKDWVKENYDIHRCGWTEMRSYGNYTDVFQDGAESGTSWAAYQVGCMLGMDLDEPEEPDYEEPDYDEDY